MIISNLDKIKIVAHRGGKFDEENTLANFKKALNYAQIHPDINFMIELDIQSPKSNIDGSNGDLVVIHDSTVNRTTLGKGLVSTYTQSELTSLPIRNLNQKRLPKFTLPLTRNEHRCGPLLQALRSKTN